MKSSCISWRRIRTLAAAGLLLCCLAARAQAPMPIPVAPSPALVVLAVLLEAAFLGSLFSRSDEKEVRELERRHDWAGLSALADRRLRALADRGRAPPSAPGHDAGAEGGDATGATTGEATGSATAAARPEQETADARKRADRRAFWLLVRAHAKRRLGDCAGSVADHRAAAALGARPPPAAELERGQCEMSLARWEDAEQTMLRAAQAAPALWEPHFNLAVIRSLRGDASGVREALADLRARNPAAADAFETGFGVALARVPEPRAGEAGEPASWARRIPVVGPELSPSTPAGWLAAGELAIGGRALRLPPGAWLLASASGSSISGRISGASSTSLLQVRGSAVPTTVAVAVSAAGGFVDSIVVYEANPRQAAGVDDWDAPACRPVGALHADRFDSRFDRPECLSLHRIDAAAIEARPGLAGLAERVGALGLSLHPAWYAAAYSGYGVSAMARVTVYRPVRALPGDLVAIDWARLLADAVRPLAEGRTPTVTLPQ